MNISATILAAGSSQRMHGKNKLLLPFKDKTLINAVCQTIIDSHLEPVFVVTGFENKKVACFASLAVWGYQQFISC